MNYLDVQLIGVFDTPPEQEMFCYTVDLPAPWNLWVSALCEDGTRMHHIFMAFLLNGLIAEDKWNEGDSIELVDQDGAVLRATVTALVDKSFVEAFASQTPGVRMIKVEAA